MDNTFRMVSDTYKKFGLDNTSKSENSLNDDVRFFQRIVLTEKERRGLPTNASFFMGTLIHEAVQSMLVKNLPIEDVMIVLNKKVDEYKGLDEKDQKKAELISRTAKQVIKNFVGEVLRLDDGRFKAETEYTHWHDDIGTYFRMFLDLEGSKYFFDFKNLFGSIRKNKSGYAITKRKIEDKIFTKDIMSMALYQKAVPHLKPCLIYATEDEVIAYHEGNTPEFKPENLEKYYNELIMYQKIWENKLEYADGSVEKLASIIRVDWSSIRKQDIFWKNIPKEYFKRLYDLYKK